MASSQAESAPAIVIDAVTTAPISSPGLRASRYAHLSLAAGVLAVIALVAALYLARAFFIPLLIGILASYTLRPLVDWLRTLHIPRGIGAALVLSLLVGGVSWVAVALSDDVSAMIEKLPDAARKLRQDLSDARTGGPTSLQKLQETANELQLAASDEA